MFSFWDQAEGAAAAQGSSIPEKYRGARVKPTIIQGGRPNHVSIFEPSPYITSADVPLATNSLPADIKGRILCPRREG